MLSLFATFMSIFEQRVSIIDTISGFFFKIGQHWQEQSRWRAEMRPTTLRASDILVTWNQSNLQCFNLIGALTFAPAIIERMVSVSLVANLQEEVIKLVERNRDAKDSEIVELCIERTNKSQKSNMHASFSVPSIRKLLLVHASPILSNFVFDRFVLSRKEFNSLLMKSSKNQQ